jgi:hypothetical protein
MEESLFQLNEEPVHKTESAVANMFTASAYFARVFLRCQITSGYFFPMLASKGGYYES